MQEISRLFSQMKNIVAFQYAVSEWVELNVPLDTYAIVL